MKMPPPKSKSNKRTLQKKHHPSNITPITNASKLGTITINKPDHVAFNKGKPNNGTINQDSRNDSVSLSSTSTTSSLQPAISTSKYVSSVIDLGEASLRMNQNYLQHGLILLLLLMMVLFGWYGFEVVHDLTHIGCMCACILSLS